MISLVTPLGESLRLFSTAQAGSANYSTKLLLNIPDITLACPEYLSLMLIFYEELCKSLPSISPLLILFSAGFLRAF